MKDTIVRLEQKIVAMQAEINAAKEEACYAKFDSDRLDRLELYHREMDDFDRKTHPGMTMWVLFAKDGVQGETRRIIDAALTPNVDFSGSTPLYGGESAGK